MAYKRGPSKASIAKGRQERYRRIEEMRQKTNERLRKKSIEEQDVPGLVMGAAVSVAKKDKINKKVKDKINKIGEMKVKDVASSIGKAFAVTTPIGIGRTISRKLAQATDKTPSKQERIERTEPRMPKVRDEFLREKNKRKPQRLSIGGMCRGMGAAIKGGKFGGVK